MWSHLTDHLLTHGIDVPIAIRDNLIKASDRIAHVVSVFVGAKDVPVVETCLTKHPFMECELLLRKYKIKNPDRWAKSVEVHKELSEATRVVKILNANENFLCQLRTTMEQDPSIHCKFMDITRKGFQDTCDILYVQCHQLHKEYLTSWRKRYIANLNLATNPKTNPWVDDTIQSREDASKVGTSNNSTSLAKPAAPLTKFHYMHGDDSFHATTSS